MGAVLRAAEIADLITTTQRELGKMKWTMIATDLQEYVALPKMLRKEKVQFDSGTHIQWNVMTDISRAAKHTGLFQKDAVNVGDVMKTASIEWRHCTTNYSIERREIAMNRRPAKIVDLVKVRRTDAMVSLAEELETAFWSKPTDSTDELMPFGVPYWVVKSATDGFNGGNPTGFAAGCAGLSSTTYARWKNYTFQYTNVSKDDCVTKMRKAFALIHFKPPVEVAQYNRGNRYGIYVAYTTLAALETLGEQQNENLGKDIASMDGSIMFRRTPITWVPKLDSDTDLPIYFLNWGVFYPVFLEGEYLLEDGPEKAPEQHTVFTTHVDLTWNLVCRNRRLLAVGKHS